MSLRSDLWEALGDPARLSRLAEGSVSDVAFCSRVLRDVGALWIAEAQEFPTLLANLAQYGWRPGGMAAAAFWYDERSCGFVHRTTPDASRFRSIDLPAGEHGWRAPLKSRDGLMFLAAPG